MTLLQFLGELANDPPRQLEFQRRPVETARESRLPESVIAVRAGRDSARLRELLADGEGSSTSHGSETAYIYSPETAFVYSPETAYIYSPETAYIYSAEGA